jgi:hypothetical protein
MKEKVGPGSESVISCMDPQIRIRDKTFRIGDTESAHNNYPEDISIFKHSLPVGKLTLVISPL